MAARMRARRVNLRENTWDSVVRSDSDPFLGRLIVKRTVRGGTRIVGLFYPTRRRLKSLSFSGLTHQYASR